MGERVLCCTKKMASEQSPKGAEESAPLMLGECGKCPGQRTQCGFILPQYVPELKVDSCGGAKRPN